MKLASNVIISVLVIWILLVILDMWFDIVSWEVFIKLTITLGLVAVIVLVFAVGKRGNRSQVNINDDKHTD
ncbi:MAG: hypothetical protein KTR16_03440 [Acidiferrobacterales bacterium]|nr:hypothetical protein [Acidiferrobacterales bacterium]